MSYATKNFNIEEFKDLELYKVKQFSDCTCFALPPFSGSPIEGILTGVFLTWIKGYNFYFLNKNLYLRGGISSGYHYQDDNIIFSEGLNQAYELETKKAVYPRIILDENLVQTFKRLWKNQKENLRDFGIDKLLVKDWDGTTFINPFKLIQTMGVNTPQEIISESKSQIAQYEQNFYKTRLQDIKNNIQKYENNKKIQTKYLWLEELLKWNMDPNSSNIKFEYFLNSK